MEAAEKAGVKRFILNDYGNSIVTQTGLPELERFRTTKREDLEHAKQLSATNPSFHVVCVGDGELHRLFATKVSGFRL